MVSNNAPKKALQKPSISIPGTKYATKRKSNAFMTRIKSPSVNMFIGNVRKINMGLINKFTRAITIAAISAETKLEIVIPGITQPVNIIAKANANHFKKIIILSPYDDIIESFYG